MTDLGGNRGKKARRRPGREGGAKKRPLATVASIASWPPPQAPVISAAMGYVVIPRVAVPPGRMRKYLAIFDATRGADKPTDLIPAVDMAGFMLNAFRIAGVSRSNARFVVVFHGLALDGLLDDTHYRARFGVPNPNLPVLEQFRKAGVELFVCGQNLAFAQVDPKTLTPSVLVASDASIVLMTYQNRGYALLSDASPIFGLPPPTGAR
jgi:intracellular sulfur oxidation DsrE/DsrF family protein